MRIRSKLLMFTATAALCANMAFAAIDTQGLADGFIADGYTYVEIKVGPTQTKLEAVKGATKLEIIYDNVTGKELKRETEAADDDYVGRRGVEIENVNRDFEDSDDDDDSDDDNDDDSDDDDEDDDSSGRDDDDDDNSSHDDDDDDHDDDDDSDSDSDDDDSDDDSDDSSDD